jgi:hypothetical protein
VTAKNTVSSDVVACWLVTNISVEYYDSMFSVEDACNRLVQQVAYEIERIHVINN